MKTLFGAQTVNIIVYTKLMMPISHTSTIFFFVNHILQLSDDIYFTLRAVEK